MAEAWDPGAGRRAPEEEYRPPWMPPADFEEELAAIRELPWRPWETPEFYMPAVESWRQFEFRPPPAYEPREYIPPFQLFMPPTEAMLPPAQPHPDIWGRIGERFPGVARAVGKFGLPALEWMKREALEPTIRGLRGLLKLPGWMEDYGYEDPWGWKREEELKLPEATAELALGLTFPARAALKGLYEAPQLAQKQAMKAEYFRRYLEEGLEMPPPTGMRAYYSPEQIIALSESGLTEEQINEMNVAYQVGEFYPTLLWRPHMRQRAFDMIQAGKTADEIMNTPGMYSFWAEFIGDVLTDPAWFIPAKWIDKVIPFSELLGYAATGLRKIPVIRSLFSVTRLHRMRQFMYQTDDALRQFVIQKAPDETLVGRFARLLANDEGVYRPMGPRLRTALEGVRDLFLGRDRELRALGERYPPAYLAGLSADERALLMARIVDEAEDGVFRVLERFADPEQVEKMVVGEFTDEDLLLWIRQAVSRAKRAELGLVPRKGALGTISRWFGLGGRLFREGLIGPNIAFHQLNTIDSLLWMALDGQFPNFLDAPLIHRIARLFGREEMVPRMVGRLDELGLPYPSKLMQPYVGTVLGEGMETFRPPRLLWHRIPVPFVGKPLALLDAFEGLSGKPLGQIARSWAKEQGSSWGRRKAGSFIAGLQDDAGMLAKFLNRINVSSAMQLITDEAQTELWVRAQTVAQEVFPGTDKTRIEMGNLLKARLLEGGASDDMAHRVWMDVTNPNKVRSVPDLIEYMARLKSHWGPRLGSYEMQFIMSPAVDSQLMDDLARRLEGFAAVPGTREELEGIFFIAERDAEETLAKIFSTLAPEQVEIDRLRRLGVAENIVRGYSDEVAKARLLGQRKVKEVEDMWHVIFERLGEAEGFRLEDIRTVADHIRNTARAATLDPVFEKAATLRERGMVTGRWDEIIPQIRAIHDAGFVDFSNEVNRLYMDFVTERMTVPELQRLMRGDPRWLGVTEAVELAALAEEIQKIAELPWDAGLKAELDGLEAALRQTRGGKAMEMVLIEGKLQELRGRAVTKQLKKDIANLEGRIRALRTSIDVGPTGEYVARSAGEYAEMAQEAVEAMQEIEALRAASEALPPPKLVFRLWDYRTGQIRKVKLPDGRSVSWRHHPDIAKRVQELGFDDPHVFEAKLEEAVRVRATLRELSERYGTMPEMKIPTDLVELKSFIEETGRELTKIYDEFGEWIRQATHWISQEEIDTFGFDWAMEQGYREGQLWHATVNEPAVRAEGFKPGIEVGLGGPKPGLTSVTYSEYKAHSIVDQLREAIPVARGEFSGSEVFDKAMERFGEGGATAGIANDFLRVAGFPVPDEFIDDPWRWLDQEFATPDDQWLLYTKVLMENVEEIARISGAPDYIIDNLINTDRAGIAALDPDLIGVVPIEARATAKPEYVFSEQELRFSPEDIRVAGTGLVEEVSDDQFRFMLTIYEEAMDAYKELVPEQLDLVNRKGELTSAGRKYLDGLRRVYDETMTHEPYLSARARNEARKLSQRIGMLERGAFGLPRAEEIMEGKRSIISLLQEEAVDILNKRDEATVANAQRIYDQTMGEISAWKAAALEQYEPLALWAQHGLWMRPEDMATAANQLGMWEAGPWMERAWNKHVGDPNAIPTSMDDLRRLFEEDPVLMKRWQDYLWKKMQEFDLPTVETWKSRAVDYPGGAAPIANFDAIEREVVEFMARGYEEALDRGLAKVKERFFDYTEEYGFDAFLKTMTPFHLFLTRNIVRWPTQLIRRPGLLNVIRRIPEGSMKFVQQHNLTSRFEGTVPLPIQPLQDADHYIEMGLLPPIGHGYMYVVDTTSFFSIFGEVPLIYGKDDLPWGWEEETTIGKIARSPELFGLSYYPWFRWPIDILLGLRQDLPSQDLTYMTRVIKNATGIDIEDPLDRYKTQFDETVIAEYYANLRLLDYYYYFIEEGITVDGEEVDLERFTDAVNNPEDPLFQRALQEVKEYHAKLNLVRCFEPFGLRGISPAELKARALLESFRVVGEGQEYSPHPLLLGYWQIFDDPHEAELSRLRNQWTRDIDKLNVAYSAMTGHLTLGTKAWEDAEEIYWEGRNENDAKYEALWADAREEYVEAGVPEEELPLKFEYVREGSPIMEGPKNRTIVGWYSIVDYWRKQIYDEEGNIVNPELFPRYIGAREAFLNQLDMETPGEWFWGRREFEQWLHRWDSPEEAVLQAWEELYARPAGTVIYPEIPEGVSDEERERLQAEKNEKEAWANSGRDDRVGLVMRVLQWHPDWLPGQVTRVIEQMERLPEWDQWSRRNQDVRGALVSVIWNLYMSGYVQTGRPFFEWLAGAEDQNTADAFRMFMVDRERRHIDDLSPRTLLLVAERLGGVVELATEGFDRELIDVAEEYGEEDLANEIYRYMWERPDILKVPDLRPPILEPLGIEETPEPSVPPGAVISPWIGHIREQLAIAEEEEQPLDIPDWDEERVVAAILVVESGANADVGENHFTYGGRAYTAVGLGQVVAELTPYTVEELRDPSLNIRETIRDLHDKLQAAGGDLKTAYYNYTGGDAWDSVARFEQLAWNRFMNAYNSFYEAPPRVPVVEPEEPPIPGLPPAPPGPPDLEEMQRVAVEQQVPSMAVEGIPPAETRISLRGEVYPYLTEEEAVSYAEAKEGLDEYWRLREEGRDEEASDLWEVYGLSDWFGDPDSSKSLFWGFWFPKIPPGWRSSELKDDPVVSFVLDRGLRELRPGGEPLVDEPQYREAYERVLRWYARMFKENPEMLGDPAEFEQARREWEEYQALFFTPEYKAYLDMSTEERRAYRKENPWLYEHWEAMRAWREEHPIMTKYYMRPEAEAGPPRAWRGGGGGGFGRRRAAPSPRIRSWADFDAKLKEQAGRMYGFVMEALRSYWTAGTALPPAILAILMALYKALAYGGVAFEEWLAILHALYRRRRGGGRTAGYTRRRRPVTWRIPRY